MITILRQCVARNIWLATLKVKVTEWPCSKIVPGPLLRYLKSDLTTFSERWSPYWIDVSHTTFGSLAWRSMSQNDLAAETCLAYNFVIWSRNLQLFHRNDHHIETMCRAQHLGYFESLNFVCNITLTLLEDTFLCPKPIWETSPGSTGSC
jgi:hypothetical protein